MWGQGKHDTPATVIIDQLNHCDADGYYTGLVPYFKF